MNNYKIKYSDCNCIPGETLVNTKNKPEYYEDLNKAIQTFLNYKFNEQRNSNLLYWAVHLDNKHIVQVIKIGD